MVVRRGGDIIAEHDFEEQKTTLLLSVSKTFTSMGIGIAENEGYFRLNDKIADYFADDSSSASFLGTKTCNLYCCDYIRKYENK
ncbi:serine hydrolase [Pelosinus fermentans]|uniref:serine hydrolase n=1 Tax=Pelosinus fermentans TaxID=365349 RepID=UPI001910FF3F|nr:serine hydrolase [Pelosinus fermentans]